MAKTLSSAYGPKGRNVVVDRPSGILVTCDGVSIAQELLPQNPLERIGTRILLQSCVEVGKAVGDGTTTSALIAAEIIRHAQKMIVAGFDPGQICKGIRLGFSQLCKTGVHHLVREIETEEDLCWVAGLAAVGSWEIVMKRLLKKAKPAES